MADTTPFTLKANKFGEIFQSLPDNEYVTIILKGSTLQLELGSALPFDGTVEEMHIALSPIHIAMLYKYLK